MTTLHSCVITETLHEGRRTDVLRGRREADGRPVVLKVLRPAAASPAAVAQFRREHALLHSLAEFEGVPTPLELVREPGEDGEPDSWVMVFDDSGARSLRDAGLVGACSSEALLRLALSLSALIGGLHERRVIHKDINPDNLIQDPEHGRVQLIDLGVATSLEHEQTGFVSPTQLEGTLRYIAPEQTGRMNRALDYRADFYALGVTLYELATGRPPFTSDDPLELVHCHVARTAPAPAQLVDGLPPALSDIIVKLMAKSADDRYQSAAGLAADLRRCLEQLSDGRGGESFALGTADRRPVFVFPRKLYGRERELDALLAAFARASAGEAMLVEISGYSGVGKSALVHELYRPLTRRRGYFIWGKFEQLVRREPFAALAGALRELVAQLLTEDERHLQSWREQLGAGLGDNADALLSVCPELAHVLGEPRPGRGASAAPARDRLLQAVRDLIAVVATDAHPLCMFFDDLQWADAATLELLEELMYSLKHLPVLLLGAHRDNEVDDAHPLAVSLRELERDTGRVVRLSLEPLALDEVGALVADTLSADPQRSAALAELLVDRTGGNPFFLRTFMRSLHDQGLLSLGDEGWRWDTARIRRQQVTDNVVEAMNARIDRLSDDARELLAVAACVGLQFSLGGLAVVSASTPKRVAAALWPSLREGLLLPVDQVHSEFDVLEGAPELRFRFAHDRIQEAALSRVEAGARAQMHLDIGRRLLADQAADAELQRDEAVFDIVGQLSRGREHMSEAAELRTLAELQLRAARRALAAAAGRQGLDYACAGLELLPDEAWERDHELTRALHMCTCEAAVMCGDHETFARVSARVLGHAREAMDSVMIRRWEGDVHFASQRQPEALQAYARALALLGEELPEQPGPADIGREQGAAAELLGERSTEELLRIPECTDARARAVMEILEQMIGPAQSSMSPLLPIVVSRFIQMSCRHGTVPATSFAYVFYGGLLAAAGDIARAYELGELAVELAERYGDKSILGRVHNYSPAMLLHYRRTLAELNPHFQRAYRCSVEVGDRFFAGACATTWSVSRLLSGDALGPLAEDIGGFMAVLEQYRQTYLASFLRMYRQAVANLRERSDDPRVLVGEFFDEREMLPSFAAANDQSAIGTCYIFKTILAYSFGDYEAALEAVEANEPHLPLYLPTFFGAPLSMVRALTRIAVAGRRDERERGALLEAADVDRERLAGLAQGCPAGAAHKLSLVDAERARVDGRVEDARASFRRAVELSQASGCASEAALASELAARFHIELDEAELAREYMQGAHASYMRWGAFAKLAALERAHPQLLSRALLGSVDPSALAAIDTEGWDASVLDLVGLFKASQALSREVERGPLLVRLMQLMVETSGASAGGLVLERDGVWVVEVIESAESEAPVLLESLAIDALEDHGHRSLPAAVIRYVARTRESVVLDDAAASPLFGDDPHIQRHGVKSALCLPLARQSGQPGLLYLENDLVTAAFTQTRINVLRLLCTQAVIALDNAQLYDNLEQKVATRTRELAQKNDELARALEHLREAQARMLVQERLASLGALTAGIAHELRNPLNFVKNFARLSKRPLTKLERHVEQGSSASTEAAAKALRTLDLNLSKIEEHGERLDAVVRAMLNHSREDDGEHVDADLNALVAEHVALVCHGVEARGQVSSVELALADGLPAVRVSPQQLGRVIINLVDNACFATKARLEAADGGYTPTVRISTHERGASVEIRVWDNGLGIPTELRARIFEPFFTTKSTGEGTGLGLSLSHEIVVRGHGGELSVDSEEGMFTEFCVALPKSG